MKLKHGKKYETADGVVYRVRNMNDGFFDESDGTNLLWLPNGEVAMNFNLIRRHYTKPKPAHKLGLKQGDVVELVAWEGGDEYGIGQKLDYSELEIPSSNPKGNRPLFRVVSRASCPKQPS